MSLAFKQSEIELVDPVVLETTASDFSMPYVSGLLEWLEGNGARIFDDSWKSASFGNLVENGIELEFETVTFRFTCSHSSLIVHRVAGNKAKFWGLCELFKDTEC